MAHQRGVSVGEFIEQHYWMLYAADFIFRSACYVTFAILLVIIARRLRVHKSSPPKPTRDARPVGPAIMVTKAQPRVELEVECVERVRLKPGNPCPRPNCGCTHQRDEVTGLPYGCTDSDPPKASE